MEGNTFSRLKALGRQFDKEYDEIKRQLSVGETRPISSQTKKRLHATRKDIRQTNQQAQELLESMQTKGRQFFDMLTLTEKLLTEDLQKIARIEDYFKSYGYIPCERVNQHVSHSDGENNNNEDACHTPPAGSRSLTGIRTPRPEDFGISVAKDNEYRKLMRDAEERRAKADTVNSNKGLPSREQHSSSSEPEIFQHRGIIVTPSLFGKREDCEGVPESPYSMNYADLITPAAQASDNKIDDSIKKTDFSDVKVNLEHSYDGEGNLGETDAQVKVSLFKSSNASETQTHKPSGHSKGTFNASLLSMPEPPVLMNPYFQTLVSQSTSTACGRSDSSETGKSGLGIVQSPVLRTPAFQKMASMSKNTGRKDSRPDDVKHRTHLDFTRIGMPEPPVLTSDLKFMVKKRDFQPLPQTPELQGPTLSMEDKPTVDHSVRTRGFDVLDMEMPQSPELTVFRGLKEQQNVCAPVPKPDSIKQLDEKYKYGVQRTVTPSLPQLYRDKFALTNLKTPSPPKLIGTYSFLQNNENIPPK